MSSTLDWLTCRPLTAVGYERAYLDLPVFNYATAWAGASQVICQFNFAASNNFVLRYLPTKPAGVNYCLAIKYRVGSTVYRWKLWEDVGEVMPNIGLYDPATSVVKKNFVLEVWDTQPNATVSQSTALRLFTSVKRSPANVNSVADYSEATGALVYPLQNQNVFTPVTPPSTGLEGWYTANDLNGSNDMIDLSGKGRNLVNGGVSVVTGAFGGKASLDYLHFIGAGPTMDFIGAVSFNISSIFVAVRANAFTSGRKIVDCYDTVPGDAAFIAQNIPNPQIAFLPSTTAQQDLPLGTGYILVCGTFPGTSDGIYRCGSSGYQEAYVTSDYTVQSVKSIVLGGTDMDVVALLLYSSAVSDENRLKIVQYLSQLIDVPISLPLTFVTGAEGGDNT